MANKSNNTTIPTPFAPAFCSARVALFIVVCWHPRWALYCSHSIDFHGFLPSTFSTVTFYCACEGAAGEPEDCLVVWCACHGHGHGLSACPALPCPDNPRLSLHKCCGLIYLEWINWASKTSLSPDRSMPGRLPAPLPLCVCGSGIA